MVSFTGLHRVLQAIQEVVDFRTSRALTLNCVLNWVLSLKP